MLASLRLYRTAALVTALVGVLAARDDVVRGGDAPRAIDAIASDLVADEPTVRAKAAAELVDRFPDGAVAVPMLVDLLDDESPDVAAAAARTLDSMSVAGAIVLTESCADRARLAAKARYGKAFADVVAGYSIGPDDALADDEPVTAGACLLAALLAPGEGAWVFDPVPRWEAALLGAHRRGKDDAQALAAAGLAMLGADALASHGVAPTADARHVAAAKALVPLVASDDVMQSWCGARIAMRLRVATSDLVAALAETLVAKKTAPDSWRRVPHDTRNPWLKARFDRVAAVEALAEIGPSAAAAAPRLAAILADPTVTTDSRDRDPEGLVPRSVRALVRAGRESDVGAVFDRNPTNALYLARLAAQSGCSAGLVLSRLADEAARPDARREAFLPMAALGPADAFAGLAALGPAAADALPVVRARFRETTDEMSKEAIAKALVAISPADPEAIDFLAAVVRGKDLSMSDNASGYEYDAWSVLCRAAPTPTVVRVLADDINGERHAVGGLETIDALGRAGPLAAGAIPGLIDLAHFANSSDWVEGWKLPCTTAAGDRVRPDRTGRRVGGPRRRSVARRGRRNHPRPRRAGAAPDQGQEVAYVRP